MIANEFEESVWYQTLSLKTLHEAVRRLEEPAYRTMCPTSKLRRLHSLERADASVMATNISRAMQSYTAELEKKQDDEPGMHTGPVIGIGENDTQDDEPGIGENDTGLEPDTLQHGHTQP